MNKSRKYPTLLWSIIVLVQYSCTKDFIVTDIGDKSIVVNAPARDLITASNLVTFWWEPLEGAEKYTLQLVKPTFLAVSSLILDTNLTENKFNLTLNPGKYQWRLKGINGGSSTAFQTFNLTIDSTSNLADQLVKPLAPLNGYVSRDANVVFNWAGINSATAYQIQINDGVITSTFVANTTFSFSLPAQTGTNNIYTWKVKAINENSVTQFNSVQTFTIDKLPPYVSSPLTPTSSPSVAPSLQNIDTLFWLRATITNTVLDTKYDSLFISIDSLFSGISLKTKMRVNGTSLIISKIIPSLPISNGSTPYYYWKLNSVDSVGNKSANYSNFFKFKLIP